MQVAIFAFLYLSLICSKAVLLSPLILLAIDMSGSNFRMSFSADDIVQCLFDIVMFDMMTSSGSYRFGRQGNSLK